MLLATGDRVGGLFVWEAFTAREYFSLRGHTGAITEISWRPDGNVCASASEDGTVRLWEMENGGQIKSWGAHNGGVESVRYGHDGRIATAGRDRLVKVWDGAGNAQRTFEAVPDVALRAAFTHDNGRVIGSDWAGQIMVWTAADGKAVGQLTPNPPTLAERLDAAQKDLAPKQAARDQTAGAAAASLAASQKAAADLAAAQKAGWPTPQRTSRRRPTQQRLRRRRRTRPTPPRQRRRPTCGPRRYRHRRWPRRRPR